MLIKKPADIRRDFIRAGSIAGGLALAGPAFSAIVPDERRAKLENVAKSAFSTDETMNSYEDITTYNNYWEFGAGKSDPSRNAGDFDPLPWKITIDGHAEKTGTFDFDEFIKPFDLEERIYRMRCVEAWSMVIPWVGISLADVVKHYQPTSKAKYVAFQALHDPTRMPGQRQRLLDWPYREGLTIAEATNPLTSSSTPGSFSSTRLVIELRLAQPTPYSRSRPLWRGDAESKWRTHSSGRALEVRLQGHQGDRAHQFYG